MGVFITYKYMEKEESVESFREEIIKIPMTFENPPDTWWRESVKVLNDIKKDFNKSNMPEITDYYTDQINYLFGVLREASKLPNLTDDQLCAFTDSVIMDSSARMAKDFEADQRDIKVNFLPLQKLVEINPERFSLHDNLVKEKHCYRLDIKRRNSDIIDSIYLPPESKKYRLYHKGGPPRYVLDIIANSPISMQESEVPFNDFDMMAYGSAAAKEVALLLGADTEGVEFGGTKPELDFSLYARSRDTTQNEILLGSEGLYFTDAALRTAQTGHSNLTSEYIANRAIYGIDHTFVDGVKVATPRGQMRCLKSVAEGKALSFGYIPVSNQFDIGIYSLFLSKKWSKKNNFPIFLDKMYYLLEEMGHLRQNEKDIFQVLTRMHKEYPFFDFGSKPLTSKELVRWKIKKMIRQLDREYRWRNKINSSFKIKRCDDDLIERIISIKDYKPNNQFIDGFNKESWNTFIQECEKRKSKYTLENNDENLYDYFFGFQNRKGSFDDLPFEGI